MSQKGDRVFVGRHHERLQEVEMDLAIHIATCLEQNKSVAQTLDRLEHGIRGLHAKWWWAMVTILGLAGSTIAALLAVIWSLLKLGGA